MSSNKITADDIPSPDQLAAAQGGSHVDNLPSPQDLGYTGASSTPPQSTGDWTSDSVEDLGRGVANGVTLGGADEIEGALQAARHIDLKNLVENKTDELSKLKKLYKQYQKVAEQEYINSAKRSPYLYGAGQIAGTVAPAIATGGAEAIAAGGAKLAANKGLASVLPSILSAGAKGAAMGATQGALNSEGGIIGATPEEQNKLLSDTASGAEVGGALGSGGAALGAAGKAIGGKVSGYINQLKEDKPFIAQLFRAKEMGEQGSNITKRSDLMGDLYKRDLNNSQGLLKKINDTDEMLGKRVSDSVNAATEKGVTLSVPDDLKSQAQVLSEYFKKNPAIQMDAKSQNLFNGIINGENITGISPPEALTLRDQMDDILSKMKGDNSTLANYTKSQISKFRQSISGMIKDQVPGYADAAKQFEEFRRMVPETIIGKGVPADISGVRVGDLRNPDSKLLGGIQDIVQGSELPGSHTAEAKQTLAMLQDNLKSLESKEAGSMGQSSLEGSQQPSVFSKMGKPDDFMKDIRDASNTSAVIKQATGTNPQEGSYNLLKGLAVGSTTGRGKLLGAANALGRASKSNTANLSRSVFSLPNDGLKSLATNLAASSDKTISGIAQQMLKGLESNNTANVNATLFALMQNPDARNAIHGLIPGNDTPEK